MSGTKAVCRYDWSKFAASILGHAGDTATGLAFSDGTEINADVIIFKTGFLGNMRQLAGTIVGPEIENQLEDFWGLDKEGEPRGAFKPTGR